VDSSGKPAAKTTGSGAKETGDDLPEAATASQNLRPLFLYFFKGDSFSAFGSKKKKKDRELEDCKALDKEFRMRALSNILREFICAKVDVLKADKEILRKYKVRKSPTCVLVDLDGRIAWMQSGKFTWKKVEKVLLSQLKKADAKVKKLAKGKDEIADRASKRLAEIELREEYAKGEKLFQRAQWKKAEAAFTKVAGAKAEGFYKSRAEIMLQEIGAAKIYFQAEVDIKRRRYHDAKQKLDKIISDFPKAAAFRAFAQEKLNSIRGKLKKR
jgi:hypothetical protein